MPTKHALFCLMISVGCTRALQMPKPASPAPETRGVTIVDRSRAKVVTDDLHPLEAPAAVEATFRLTPDRRVLTAVADVYELSTGQKQSAVEIDFRDNAWQIRCAGQDAGSLPELATFRTNLDFLTQWAARLRSRRPIAAPLSPGALATIDRDIAAFSPPSLFAATDVIARNTKDKSLDGVAAARAAHAATLLALQIYDWFELGDPLRARSLALLAIARQSDQKCCKDDEALIADVLDYETESKSLAAALPPSSGAISEWRQKRNALRSGKASDLDVQFAPLLNSVSTFGDQVEIARAEESLILREVESNGFNAGPLTFNGDSVAYPNLNFDEKNPLPRFERALPQRVLPLQNSVLNSDSVRSYYESNFYAAVFKEFAFHHYRRGDRNGETAFIAELGKPATDVGQQVVRWMNGMTTVHYDAARGAKGPQELLSSVPLTGGIRRADLLENYARAIGNDIHLRRAAAELYLNLDSRPSEMCEAGDIAFHIVADPYHRDRYLPTAIERFPSFPSHGDIAYYRFTIGDRATLRSLVDRGPNVTERLQALSYLAQLGDADSEFVHRKFEEIAGDTAEISALAAYTNYLNEHGEPAIKERFQRRWLKKFGDRDDPIGVAWGAGSLANALDRQGKYREAWDVIEPYMSIGSENLMIHGASILQHLGRVDEANQLAAEAVQRYPNATARAHFATILWREGRLKEAAELFDPKKADYSPSDALESLPEQFFETFKDAKLDSAIDAYSALIAVRPNPQLLDAIPQQAMKEHRPDLAFALVDRLMAEASRMPGSYRPESIPPLLVGYHALKEQKGADAAFAWLQSEIPVPAMMQAIIVFYEDAEFDLVQRFAASVTDKTPEAATLEAASLLRMRVPPSDVRWEKLRERIRMLPNKPDALPMAQYLAGFIDEPTFLAAAKTRNAHIDAEYFIGVKRLADNDPETSLPMMIAASFGAPDYPPSAWGLTQLYRWVAEHASWQEIAEKASQPASSTTVAQAGAH